MKRLRSSEDLDSYNDKNVSRETLNSERSSSSSHRTFLHKSFPGNSFARKGPISPSRYDRDRHPFISGDDVGHLRGLSRRRSDRSFDGGFDDRRKDMDGRYKEDRLYRSESACFARRDFPKGFRSERERPRREGSVSSWRRFGGRGKEIGVEDRERTGISVRLRDGERERSVKSPSWSRDSCGEQSKMKAGVCGESKDSRNSRSKSKSLASPTWSKDSGSEQSKSVGNVAKKSEEEVQGKSGGSSSEMEEGELEPEPPTETASGASPVSDHNKVEDSAGFGPDHQEAHIQSCPQVIRKDSEFGDNIKKDKTESNHRVLELHNSERKMDDTQTLGDKRSGEKAEDVPNQVTGLHASDNSVNNSDTALASENKTGDRSRYTFKENEAGDVADGQSGEEKETEESDRVKSEGTTHLGVAEQIDLDELKLGKVSDLDVHKEKVKKPKCDGETRQGSAVLECSTPICKDKGKSVAVTPTRRLDSIDNGVLFEEPRDHDEDDNLEGPSIRGFELFSCSPVRKPDKVEQSGLNKQKDEKLPFEPLDLSLSLPDVLLPVGGQEDTNRPPGSPAFSGSVRSMTNTLCTDSDGFTMSMSFSGSQPFHHNPSCSLNQNAADNEQSVHSRPIFQGIDWQALALNDSMNNNGSIKPQAVKGISSSGPAGEGLNRLTDGSFRGVNGIEKPLSLQKCIDVRSPCSSMGSQENSLKLSLEKEKAKEMFGGNSISWMSGLKPDGKDDFVETVIGYILSDNMHVMDKKFKEMPTRYISSLKESIRQMMVNMDKCVQLGAFQDALTNRTDITLESLRKAHRAQLEILVSLKTGRPEFLQLGDSISSSELAEIFMNLRCKNLTCRSVVPIDDCDCRVCSRRDGFCSACMCLVCSNFDMASNTCSWVGCDVCLHWCHTDCGLRESYIQGTTEMQFHCVACGHPSEMFGFVKEVFQNFAREWNHERLCQELEYIKRIFSGSKDLRGKQLHEAATLILARLTSKAISLSDACNQILAFLSECGSSNLGEAPASLRGEQSKSTHERGGPSQDNLWLRPVYADKPQQLERPSSTHDMLCREKRGETYYGEADVKRNSPGEPLFEELESIVRIKQAEAEMFQARADEARREAEGLKRIGIAKKEKIEEEYMRRIVKLSVGEAEEVRRNKYEEFQTMEREHREYLVMKMRMEEEIRGLLMKMEATKQSLAL